MGGLNSSRAATASSSRHMSLRQNSYDYLTTSTDLAFFEGCWMIGSFTNLVSRIQLSFRNLKTADPPAHQVLNHRWVENTTRSPVQSIHPHRCYYTSPFSLSLSLDRDLFSASLSFSSFSTFPLVFVRSICHLSKMTDNGKKMSSTPMRAKIIPK